MSDLSQPTVAFSAELLFERSPTLMPQAVQAHVRALLPEIVLEPPLPGSPVVRFRHFLKVPGAAESLQTALLAGDQPPQPSDYAEALLENTDWLEALDVVKRIRSTVTLVELHGEGLDLRARELAFTKVVVGCVRALGPSAVLWKPTRQLLRPEALENGLKLLG